MSLMLPEGWAEVEFENFTSLQRGKDLTKPQFRDGVVPVAGSNGVIGYHDSAIAKAPGITVGRSGSAGKVTVYDEDFWPHNTTLYVKDFHGNDPHFAGYLLGSLNLSRFKTGASVPTLDRNSFKSLPILVPPLPEQKKIAHILSTVQRAIEAQERIIQTTTELKKAVMHKLFTEGLRNEPQKQTEIGPVPESWEVTKIGDLDLDIGDGNYSTKYPRQSAFISEGVAFLRAVNLNQGKIEWDDMRFISPELHAELRKGHTKPNDTIIVTRGNIGEVAFVTNEFVGVNMNAQLVRLNGHDRFNGRFFFYCLQHPERQKQILSLTTGTALKQLPIGKLKTVILPIPPSDEQREIAYILRTIEQKIEQAQARKIAIQDIFRTLLHDLMTAKTRVSELEFSMQYRGDI